MSFTPSEYRRALERGNDYILALVHGCEKGSDTKVKLIFDPVRRTSLRETEGIRLNGSPDAAGIVITLGPDGALLSERDKGSHLTDGQFQGASPHRKFGVRPWPLVVARKRSFRSWASKISC